MDVEWPFRLEDLLSALEHEVAGRATSWQAVGATWEFLHGDPSWSKPAVSVGVATPTALAELTIWVSGEADLAWASPLDPPVEIKYIHYELTDELGLRRCLDDLDDHLGWRT